MNTRKFVFIVAISALAIIAFATISWTFFGSGNPGSTEPGNTSAAVSSGDAAGTSGAEPSGERESAQRSPLSPAGTPLVYIIDPLARRARSGDAAAACRLSADLSACASLARSRALRDMIDPTRGLSTPPSRDDTVSAQAQARQLDTRIEIAARIDNSMEAMERMCEGLPLSETNNALKWLHQSAVSGNVRAMAEFASGRWWLSPASIHHPQVISAYKHQAQSMAEAALAAGDRSLLSVYGIALSGLPQPFNRSPLSEVVEPDPVRARALLLIADREARQNPPQTSEPPMLRGTGGLNARTALATLTASMDSASIRRSDALADELGRAFDRPSAARPRATTQSVPWVGGPGDPIGLKAEDCTP
jgi:hypothetical protein